MTKPVAVGDKVDFGFKFTLRSSVVFFVVGTLETDDFDRCSRRILKDKKAKYDRFYYQSNNLNLQYPTIYPKMFPLKTSQDRDTLLCYSFIADSTYSTLHRELPFTDVQ